MPARCSKPRLRCRPRGPARSCAAGVRRLRVGRLPPLSPLPTPPSLSLTLDYPSRSRQLKGPYHLMSRLPYSGVRLLAVQKLGHERLKVMDAVFPLGRQSTPVVLARAQTALHLLAHGNVLLLDLVGESDRLLHRLPAGPCARLGEEPFEDRERLVHAEREDDVRAHAVLVDVQHRVREEPVIQRIVLRTRHADVAPVAAWHLARLELTDGRVLLRVVAERLDAVLVVVELFEQARVCDRQVIALEIVVDVDLPVALDDIVAALYPSHGGKVITRAPDLVRDRAYPIGQTWRLVIEIGEYERPQRVDLDRHQPEVGFVEILGPLHLASRLQPAVQPVDPAVVATLQRFPVAPRRHDLRRTVAAHVVEAAEAAVFRMGQKDGLIEDRGRLEVSMTRQLTQMGDKLPGARKDALFLQLEDRGVDVHRRWQRVGAGDVCFELHTEGPFSHPRKFHLPTMSGGTVGTWRRHR